MNWNGTGQSSSRWQHWCWWGFSWGSGGSLAPRDSFDDGDCRCSFFTELHHSTFSVRLCECEDQIDMNWLILITFDRCMEHSHLGLGAAADLALVECKHSKAVVRVFEGESRSFSMSQRSRTHYQLWSLLYSTSDCIVDSDRVCAHLVVGSGLCESLDRLVQAPCVAPECSWSIQGANSSRAVAFVLRWHTPIRRLGHYNRIRDNSIRWIVRILCLLPSTLSINQSL